MKIAAVIGEYNPFHLGHKFLIDKAREAGATHVLTVMSGNFVQRGDLAVFDKFTRAKTALENGVDLVLELPERVSLMAAEGFAGGAVEIINALGCVNMLAFGSESGDISALREASGAIDYAVHSDEFGELIKRGKSYPAALQEALRGFYTEDVSETVASPNNTLAIEYLSALDNIGNPIEPFTVKRLGMRHDGDFDGASDNSAGEFASASAIRKMILAGEDYSRFAPQISAPSADISRLERAILARLRTLSADDFETIYDCANGLGNRLHKAVRGASSLSELYFLTKTKRYTLARIRRAVLCGFLGINKRFAAEKCAYIRVLGMNARGREILAAADSSLPIDTSLKALSKKSREAARQANFTARCSDIYALAFEQPAPCGTDFTSAPIILDE